MAKSAHDRASSRIAKKEGVPYNKRKGPDVPGTRRAIEVKSTAKEVPEALRQLSGSRKPRYIAVPPKEVKPTVKRVKDLKVGVMDHSGKVVKPARKPRSGK